MAEEGNAALTYMVKFLAELSGMMEAEGKIDKTARTRKVKFDVDDAAITAMAEKTEEALRRMGGSSKELEANLKESLRAMRDISAEAAASLRQRDRFAGEQGRMEATRARGNWKTEEKARRTDSDAIRRGMEGRAAWERLETADERAAAEAEAKARERDAAAANKAATRESTDSGKEASDAIRRGMEGRAAWERQQAADERAGQDAAQTARERQAKADNVAATRAGDAERRAASDAIRQRLESEAKERKNTTASLYEEEVARRARRYQRLGWEPDKARSAAETSIASESRKLAEGFKRLKEPLSIFEEGLRTIGQGGWRRGTAQIVTATLGGGAMAELVGGFMGGVTSAIALPIAWAIGNDFMNLPQRAAAEIAWQRYVSSLGSRATGGPRGSQAWNDAVAQLRHFADQYYLGAGTSEQRASKAAIDMTGRYQEVASRRLQPGDEAGERDRIAAMRRDMLNTIALGMGPNARVKNPADFMAVMADLRFGDADTARKALLNQQSWLRETWFEKHKAEGPRWVLEQRLKQSLTTPQTTADAYKQRTGRILAGSREEIEDLIQHEVATNPYVTGEVKHQTEMFRKLPRGGFGFIPDEATLRGKEAEYVKRMHDLESRYDPKTGERKYTSKDWRNPGAAAADMLTSPTRDKELKKLREWAMSEPLGVNLLPKRTQEYHKSLTPQRLMELEKLARGEIDPKTLYPDSNRKTDLVTPSQYNWTSFSGMAEQMQQMWSGAPVDAMQTAATTLGRIEGILNQRLPAAANAGNAQPAVPAP